MLKKVLVIVFFSVLMMSVSGCGNGNATSNSNSASSEDANVSAAVSNDTSTETDLKSTEDGETLGELEVRFGTNSKTFMVTLYDNDTTAELVRNIDADGMNLPIYHFDDFENYKVMQYYDIPSSFKIPSDPETVTSEKAGELYYSAPNRVILFYQDAEISGEFTKVGYMEDVKGLKDSVEDNTVVPGWSNKIISVDYSE